MSAGAQARRSHRAAPSDRRRAGRAARLESRRVGRVGHRGGCWVLGAGCWGSVSRLGVRCPGSGVRVSRVRRYQKHRARRMLRAECQAVPETGHGHRTPDTGPNTQHPTPNTQHPTPNTPSQTRRRNPVPPPLACRANRPSRVCPRPRQWRAHRRSTAARGRGLADAVEHHREREDRAPSGWPRPSRRAAARSRAPARTSSPAPDAGSRSARSQPADENRGEIGEDVAEEISGDDHLKRLRRTHEIHRHRVNVARVALDVRDTPLPTSSNTRRQSPCAAIAFALSAIVTRVLPCARAHAKACE